ncbi:MAG: hypothetical protein CMJ89_16705 [Planctomycetes bacterium]|jgi:diguanylate cyclase (GGDEF)-like protein|nr:hypothetical protein [Planctomycetota bacterium]
MFKKRFEKMKHTGKLPTPSGLGMRLLVLTWDEECSIGDVVQTIQTDPVLTSRVIKLANSVKNTRQAPASTVKDAAARLGTKSVCSVGLGFSLILGNRTGKCPSFPYDEYWGWSLANALAAKQICERLSLQKPAEVFTCALLMRIGRLALASAYPDEYSEVLNRLQNGPVEILERVERERFAIDNREISAGLMEDWRLPDYFSQVALHFNGQEPPPGVESEEVRSVLRILNCSSRIANVCSSEAAAQPIHWRAARDFCDELGIDLEAFTELYDETVAEWNDWGELFGIPTRSGLEGVSIEKSSLKRGGVSTLLKEGRLRVLAVDDHEISLRLLVAHLEGDGYEVKTARNGKEALEVNKKWAPQMVITDWMMPEMDGLELCQHLRATEAGRKLYILVLTGRDEEDHIVEVFEAGADDYIEKTGKFKLLLARTRPGLRVIKLQEENEQHLQDKQRKNAKLEIAKRRLKDAAMTDSLTELPNRRSAIKRLEKEWADSSRTRGPLAAIILDIDHFKAVNDNYGHDIGDAMLWSTAQAINRSLRRGDTCARIGGEEFLVICPNTTLEGAKQLAERIRVAVEENEVTRPGFTGSVTVSLGVGYRAQGILSIDQLIKMADNAVYQAKRSGRNCVAAGYPEDRRQSA